MKIKLKSFRAIVLLVIFVFSLFLLEYGLRAQDNFFNEEENINTEFEGLIEDFISSVSVDPANPLALGKKDYYFEKGNKFFDLYIKKRESINSVLIIYVVEDVLSGNRVSIDYGLRALEYNSVNGDEIRVLNGVELGKEQGLFFLVDSTPEPHVEFGQAFKIRIPTYAQYGYTKENFGLVRIDEGSKLKIRSFEFRYADYSGKFNDSIVEVNTTKTVSTDYNIDVSRNPKVFLDPNVEYNLTQTEDGKFIIAHIRYEDDSRFFKDFLIREKPLSEEIDVPFKPVSFKIEDIPESNKAILLSSIFQNNMKVIRAKIYLERRLDYRIVEISARDSEGNKPLKNLTIEIPRLGEEINYKIENIPGYDGSDD